MQDAAGDDGGDGGDEEQGGGGGDGHLSDSGSTVLAQRLPPGSPLPASALRVPFRPKLGVPPHLSLGDVAAGGSGSGSAAGGRTAGGEAPARPQDEGASPQAGWVRAPPELRHLPTQPSGLDLGAPGLTQAELAVWGAAAAIAATRGSAPTQYEEDGASMVSTPPGARVEEVVQHQQAPAYTAPAVSTAPLAVPSRPAPVQQVTAAALLGAGAGVDPLAAASMRRREEGPPSSVEHHASFMRPVAPAMPSRTRSLLGATGSAQPQRPTAQPMPSSSALAAPQPVVPSRRPPSVDAYREGYLEGQREAEQALAVQRLQSEPPGGGRDGSLLQQQQAAPVYDPAAQAQQSSAGGASNQTAKRAALAAVAEAARQRAAARSATRATVRERAQQEQARAHARVVDPFMRDGGSRGESPVYGEAGAAAFQRSRPFSPDHPPAAASGEGGNNSGWADALSSVPQAAVIHPLVPPPQSGASALQPSQVLTQQTQSRPTAPFFEARRQDLRARVEAAAARAAAAADAGVPADVVNVYAAVAAAKRASPTFSPRTGRPGAPPSAAASSGVGLYEDEDE
jgi:hypothetical protein